MQSLNMYIFNKVDMISCSDLGLREAPQIVAQLAIEIDIKRLSGGRIVTN